ncbi:hypothetical protein [Novipirellula sp.]|uniref:hypothetical protein n=1 Tax=Novipirellula sp. TaxID=2795430 RepID=UPI0035614D68
MNSYIQPLSQLLDAIPDDLQAFYAQVQTGDFSGHSEVEVNLLSPADATKLTLEFREFNPLVDMSRCILLDEANTSDYLCYLPGPPKAGAIFHLSHDGQPAKIVFRDTQALLDAAKQAIASGAFLETLFDRQSFVSEDQDELVDQIREAFSLANEYEMTPLLDLLLRYAEYDRDPELFSQICEHDDFFVPQAIAETIQERPKRSYLPLAQKLASNNVHQVARPAADAVAQIEAIPE